MATFQLGRLREALIPRWQGFTLTLVVVVAACAVMCSAVAEARTVRPAAERLVPSAMLAATSASGRLSFGDVAISGSTVVADSFDTRTLPYTQTGVYVFTEPRGGWANERPAAQLVASTGEATGPVAASGNNVFVIGSAADGSEVVYVFTKPGGGWSGIVKERAQLVASPAISPLAVGGSAVAASGRTVVASGGGAAYVFTEPAGGWSGTIHQTARLTASDGPLLRAVGLSESTVVAGESGANNSQNTVYVFQEPTAGWARTIHETARLIGGSAAVAVSGATVVSALDSANGADQQVLYVFSKPKAGWAGIVNPRARLALPASYDALGPDLGISGQTLAALSIQPNAHVCPCSGAVYALHQPPGGWAGSSTVSRNSAADATTDAALAGVAIDNQTLVVGADDAVQVFRILSPPTIRSVSVQGLASGRPRLNFSAVAGAGAPSIKSVIVGLPAGLRFSRSITKTARGIALSPAARPGIALSHGKLVLTFRQAVGRVSIQIAAPALVESPQLVAEIDRAIRFNRTHKNKRWVILTLTVRVVDAARTATSLSASITSP